MDMIPRLTHHDLVNARQVDVVIGGDRAKCFALGATTANVPYGVLGQLRESVSLSSSHAFRVLAIVMIVTAMPLIGMQTSAASVSASRPSARVTLLNVLPVRPDVQVVRPDAWRVVAMMEYAGTLCGDRTASKNPRDSVSRSLTQKPESAIASVEPAGPYPTRTEVRPDHGTSFDLRPEVLGCITLASSHRRVSLFLRDSGGQRSPAVSAAVGLARHFTTGGA